MLKGLFQVNKNKYLFALHPFLSLPTPPSSFNTQSQRRITKNDWGWIFLGGNDSLHRKRVRTDKKLPQTVATDVQKGELDGKAHSQSEATLDGEVVGPRYLLLQCLPLPL